jgi:putative transport protein
VSEIFSSIFFALFLAVALGVRVGAVRLGGVSFGPAGVFFVALALGHWQWSLPRELTELGLVLFVYAIGLQTGPRFLGVLRSFGPAVLWVGLGATLLGAGTAAAAAWALGLPPDLAAGLYCGATTCTPALAAVLDALPADAGDLGASVAVGYGAAYPFSILFTVVFVQWLPRLLGTSPAAAAERYREDQRARTPPLDKCVFRVENPGCAGRSVDELRRLHLSDAVLCRLKRAGRVRAIRPETVLERGDAVLAVGPPRELAKLEALLGGVALEDMQDPSGEVASEQAVVSRPDLVGAPLASLCLWERHGVTVTRVRRDGLEIAPSGDMRLEPGDVLRLVGERAAIDEAMKLIGQPERRLDEATLVSFAGGLAAGAVVGRIPIPLPGGLQIELGLAGGAFIVALLLGWLSTRGRMRVYVPGAARLFIRDLGLVIFLAGAGMSAGTRFVPVLQQVGLHLVLAGALVTLVTAVSAGLLAVLAFRWNVLFGCGAVAAAMTNPPAFTAAGRLAPESDAATVGFAAVYPLALLAKIIWAPLLYAVLRAMP